MMKRFTSLAAAAIVAAVGLSPAWGQDVQGEDYTSHLANPSFTEGAGTQPGDTIATNGRGNIYVPAGWTLVYTNTVPTWDRQFIRYADKHGVKRRNLLIQKSYTLIKRFLYASIIYDRFDIEEYIKYTNQTDKTVQRAVEVIEKYGADPFKLPGD